MCVIMDNTLVDVGEATISPLKTIGETILNNIPGFLGGLFVIVVGYFIGLLIGHLIYKLLLKSKVDEWITKNNLSKIILNIKLSKIIKYLITWGIFIVFLAPAASLIQIKVLTEILTNFAYWIPSLIFAIILMITGLIISELIVKNIKVKKEDYLNKIISTIIQVSIIIVFLNISLTHIGVDMKFVENILLIILGGVILAFSIALGIGFGKSIKNYSDEIVKNKILNKKKVVKKKK